MLTSTLASLSQDLGRLNRSLGRCVLVDDTPLAFLHQPDNGVPVVGFRGDPDDRLLMEAVLPLLRCIANERDVRPVLRKRFDMGAWFKQHGLPLDMIVSEAQRAAEAEREEHHATALRALAGEAPEAKPAPSVDMTVVVEPSQQQGPEEAQSGCPPPAKQWLFLTDFDKTLTNCDAGECLVQRMLGLPISATL